LLCFRKTLAGSPQPKQSAIKKIGIIFSFPFCHFSLFYPQFSWFFGYRLPLSSVSAQGAGRALPHADGLFSWVIFAA